MGGERFGSSGISGKVNLEVPNQASSVLMVEWGLRKSDRFSKVGFRFDFSFPWYTERPWQWVIAGVKEPCRTNTGTGWI